MNFLDYVRLLIEKPCVAGHAGLDIRVVDFPGHILAKMGETTILDPYNGGMIVGHDELQAIWCI